MGRPDCLRSSDADRAPFTWSLGVKVKFPSEATKYHNIGPIIIRTENRM